MCESEEAVVDRCAGSTLHERDYITEVLLKTEQGTLKIEEVGGSNICRVCLLEGDIPIHGNDRFTDLPLELNALAGINVREDDEFPKHLCESCYSQLQGAIQLRTTAQYSDIILQQQRQRKEEPENSEDGFQGNDNEITGHNGHQNTGENEPKTKEIFSYLIVRNNLRVTRIKCNTSQVKAEPQEHINKSVSQPSDLLKNSNYNVMETSSTVAMQTPEVVEKKQSIINFDKLEYERKTSINKNGTETNTIIIKNKSESKPKTCIVRSNTSGSQRNPQNILITKSDNVPIAKQYEIPKQKEHPVKKFSCSRCKIYFDTAAEFGHHKKTKEHKNPNNECPICHKIYSSWANLKIHQRAVHLQEKSHICDICGKGFGWKTTLDDHIRTHSLNLPFPCSLCPYKGRNKKLLQSHMRTHTGEKPYQCDVCEIRCRSASSLKIHKMRNHQSGHDYNCDMCSRGFHYKTYLEKHIRADHMGIMDHVCELCGKEFGLRTRLTKHMHRYHKGAKFPSGRQPLYLLAEQQGISADIGATN